MSKKLVESVRLDVNLLKKLRDRAKKEGRTIKGQIERILWEEISKSQQ